jgi:hypothetical protein
MFGGRDGEGLEIRVVDGVAGDLVPGAEEGMQVGPRHMRRVTSEDGPGVDEEGRVHAMGPQNREAV